MSADFRFYGTAYSYPGAGRNDLTFSSATDELLPVGHDHSAFGTAGVRDNKIFPVGIHPVGFGATVAAIYYAPPAFVFSGVAYVYPTSPNVNFTFSTTVPAGSILPIGVAFSAFGTAGVRDNKIFPAGIPPVGFGSGSVDPYYRSANFVFSGVAYIYPTNPEADFLFATSANAGVILPIGHNQSRYGTASVRDNKIFPTGIPPGLFGLTGIRIYYATPAFVFSGNAYVYPTNPRVDFFLGLEFGEIRFGGWDSARYGTPNFVQLSASNVTLGVQTSFGTPSLANTARVLLPTGIAPGAFGGGSTITNGIGALYPTGIPPGSIGSPSVASNRRFIEVPGILSTLTFGPFTAIDYRTKRVTFPEGGWFETVIPSPLITHEIQYVDLGGGYGIPSLIFGALRLESSIRSLFPVGFGPEEDEDLIGVPNARHIVNIQPVGWDSGFVETPIDVLINTRRVYPSSGDETTIGDGYGEPTVWNFIQRINVGFFGINNEIIEAPGIKNLSREVIVGPFFENVDPTTWSNFQPVVDNAKRYIVTFGHQSSRFALTDIIENAAQAVLVDGLDATIWGDNDISHFIRTVYPEGWDSFYLNPWAVAYNAAKQLLPVSLGDTSLFGKPDPVLNLNRTVKHHSGWLGPEIGTAFIAYRVRYLTQGVFNDVPSGFPEVRFNPYPIAPPGIPQKGQVGGHSLTTFEYIIKPPSANVHSNPLIGEPRVTQRNIETTTFGLDTSEFGRLTIGNYIRYVLPLGWASFIALKSLIEHRTKYITPGVVGLPLFTWLHKIKNVAPDPPSLQKIALDKYQENGEVTEGFGIPPPAMGNIVVRSSTLYPIGFTPDIPFGNPKVRSNVLAPPFIFEDGLFGIPFIIGTQTIYVPNPFNEGYEPSVGTPRMSPFNIYAPWGIEDTPLGYTPSRPFNSHPIGANTYSGSGNSAFPWFGYHDVANRNRTIFVLPNNLPPNYQNDMLAMGFPSFENSLRTVAPYTWKSMRIGTPMFPNTPQTIDLGAKVYEDSEEDPIDHEGIPPLNHFGEETAIAFTVLDSDGIYRPRAFGFSSLVFGATFIENFNREVLPVGIDHSGNWQLVPGNEGTPVTPWGITLVGYPRTYIWSAGDLTLWGDNRVEYLNRQVFPFGWINCSLEDWNYDDFEWPMHVDHVTGSGAAPRPITVYGGIAPTSEGGKPRIRRDSDPPAGADQYIFTWGFPTIGYGYTSVLTTDQVGEADIFIWPLPILSAEKVSAPELEHA